MSKKQRAEVVITITRGKPGRAAAGKEPQVYGYTIDTPGNSTPVTNRKRYTRSIGALRSALRKLRAYRVVPGPYGAQSYACIHNGKVTGIRIERIDNRKAR